MGLTRVVHPTPMAHPVMPKPLPCALISDGNISVGMRKAMVPHVLAYTRLKRNSIVIAAGAKDDALEGFSLDPSYNDAAIRLTRNRPIEPPMRQRRRPSLSTI